VSQRSVRPVILRGGVEIEDPVSVVLGLLAAFRPLAGGEPSASGSFAEPDLRLANRNGARISGPQIAAILERRRAIERALHGIDPDASLAGAANAVPWPALRRLFDGFVDIRGVGFSKMTKALHPKRPAMIPMLDSVVQEYLQDDDLGDAASFAEGAVALVRGYKRDLDSNRSAMRRLRRELVSRGHVLSEVRILDLLIWSVAAAPGK
jgi:Family of unknown function (DUF6308)